jgi:hypothetical protein
MNCDMMIFLNWKLTHDLIILLYSQQQEETPPRAMTCVHALCIVNGTLQLLSTPSVPKYLSFWFFRHIPFIMYLDISIYLGA